MLMYTCTQPLIFFPTNSIETLGTDTFETEEKMNNDKGVRSSDRLSSCSWRQRDNICLFPFVFPRHVWVSCVS